MNMILVKDLRFFYYPEGLILFRKEADTARFNVLNYVLNKFKGEKFVFINLFWQKADPITVEEFVLEHLPKDCVVTDELVKELHIPGVETSFEYDYPEFSSSPFATECKCLIFSNGTFTELDLGFLRVKFEEEFVFGDLALGYPSSDLVVLKGFLWREEYERLKHVENAKFIGEVLDKVGDWTKLERVLLKEL